MLLKVIAVELRDELLVVLVAAVVVSAAAAEVGIVAFAVLGVPVVHDAAVVVDVVAAAAAAGRSL